MFSKRFLNSLPVETAALFFIYLFFIMYSSELIVEPVFQQPR